MTEGTSPPVGVTPVVQHGEVAQELSSGSKLDALLRLHLSHLQLAKKEREQEFLLGVGVSEAGAEMSNKMHQWEMQAGTSRLSW